MNPTSAANTLGEWPRPTWDPREKAYALFLVYVQEPDYSALSYLMVEALSDGSVEWGYGFVPVSPLHVIPLQADRTGWPTIL